METMTQQEDLIRHTSVLVDEVLYYLDLQPGKTYLDVTFGSGGHTRALLEREPECSVIAIDWDIRSIETYGPALEQEFGDRVRLVWGNFALLYRLVKKEKIKPVDGILADFGTSQMHLLERPGFSFHRDSPLDMRMAPAHQHITAAQVLQTLSEQQLRELFMQLGQERYAKQIARAVVHDRSKKPFVTTRQFAELVERIVPDRAKRKTHPATKVFQALRIYVNKELANIAAFLPAAWELLRPEGRLACISFHSLEDRLVKSFFNEKKVTGELAVVTPKVVTPTEAEVKANPAARSAKLRVAQKVAI